MSTQSFFAKFASFVLMLAIVPVSLGMVPARAQAGGLPVVDILNHISNGLDRAIQISSEAAEIAQKVNAYVLEPLAFVLSGEILKLITAGVISFVIGEANGTGIPQFVVDVQESLRTVSDSQAYAFLKQFGENSDSPFSGSIRASLEEDYFSKTSLKGFWEQNMSTLRQSSSLYSDAYLYGDWSRGGLHSWFALTTRYENNPYMLHERSKRQMERMIGRNDLGAVGARLQELEWGNGFMAWCGDFGNEVSDLPEGQVSSNPGDPCFDKDGKPRTIKTPGTVIADALDRALGYDGEKILRMGNVGPQINEILGNVATVMQTVNFATQILGGEGSGGLFGAGQTSSSQPDPRIAQLSNPGFLGATQSGVYQGASASPDAGNDLLSRATAYETAWKTIQTSANQASAALAELKTACSNHAASVQTALDQKVTPVLTQAIVALNSVEFARTTVADLQADIAASSGETEENFLPRIQALQSLAPTQTQVSEALQNSLETEGAVASPEGSFAVSGGSLVDQMNLIKANAGVQKYACTLGHSNP